MSHKSARRKLQIMFFASLNVLFYLSLIVTIDRIDGDLQCKSIRYNKDGVADPKEWASCTPEVNFCHVETVTDEWGAKVSLPSVRFCRSI